MKIRFVTLLFVGMFVPLLSAGADDIANWPTQDNANNRPPPNGWPAGMLPTQVEPTGRAMMGAISRFYHGGVVPAANTAALRAQATTNYANGIWRNTDGAANAPPLFYLPDTGNLCAADDGASCVAAAAGGAAYWRAVFPGNIGDVREWGAVEDNATDDGTALTSALTWAANTGGTLYLPGGGALFTSTGLTANVPIAGIFSMSGLGAIRFGASVTTGLQINVGGEFSSVRLRDFTLETGAASDSSVCLFLHQNGDTIINPANTPTSDISNVTCRGSDGFTVANYWGSGFYTDYQSNISFYGDSYFGAGSSKGTAINLVGGGNGNKIGVVYNFEGFTAEGCRLGLDYGTWIQGVTIHHSNFTGCTGGILNVANVGTAQLTVTDSQFGVAQYALRDDGGLYYLQFSNNTILPYDDGTTTRTFVSEGLGAQDTITGNTFDGNYAGGAARDFTGLAISGGSSGSVSTVTGNTFANLKRGIYMAPTSENVRASANNYNNVTITVENDNQNQALIANNSITGASINGYISGIQGISGNGGTPNITRLQVFGVAGITNGSWVSINGALYAPANVITPVVVVDANHIDLMTVTSDGSTFGAGGVVSALP